jgi:hypothetical protein
VTARRTVLLVVAAVLAVSGCAPRERDERTATNIALRFYAAVAAADGATACGLLTEPAQNEIEKSSSSPCDQGILDEELSDPGQPRRAEVYGDEARLELDGDTVFLSHEADGWRIAAAGCQPVPGEPDDCTIQGA